MAIGNYEREVLKNYFIRNGGFAGFSESETKLYNNISQTKFRGFADESRPIDVKAPGGMQTVFYNLMGFPTVPLESSPTGLIESYAVYLATVLNNDANLTNREYTHLEAFAKYYKFSNVDEFINKINPLIFQKYTLSDILLTFSIYSYFLENAKEAQLKKFVMDLKLNTIYDLFDGEPLEKTIDYMKKKLLPPIEEVVEFPILINDSCIQIPVGREILWRDLVIIGTLGLKYKGLYRPYLQLGAYMNYKMRGNLMGLNPAVLSIDDIHRRRFGCKNLLEFWGINDDEFPEVSYQKGYTIYPFFDSNGNYIPKDATQIKSKKLYCIWFASNAYVIVDTKILEYVHRNIPYIEFTEKYESRFQVRNVALPCIVANGVMTPLAETLTIKPPKDGNYCNLTSYNLGVM